MAVLVLMEGLLSWGLWASEAQFPTFFIFPLRSVESEPTSRENKP